MKPAFLDHSFTSIGHMDTQSKGFIEMKLKELDSIFRRIEQNTDKEVADNVTGNGFIKHSLNRCLAYYTKSWQVSEEDYHVFYEHAYRLSQEMEAMIDEGGENSLFNAE